MTNGEWLTQNRIRSGYATADALAQRLGITRNAVANWENDIGRPSMAHAEKLAPLLGKSRSEVLARYGWPIGGGLPETTTPLPDEWLETIQQAVARGVADGVREILETLRQEGRLAEPEAVDAPPRRRRRVG